jgi:hypothetical protein
MLVYSFFPLRKKWKIKNGVGGLEFCYKKKISKKAMDLPEIFQLPEGRLDFYLDELALPVPELAAPLYIIYYMISEKGKKKRAMTPLLTYTTFSHHSKLVDINVYNLYTCS